MEHIQAMAQAYQVVPAVAVAINLLMAVLVHKHQVQADQLVTDFQAEEVVQLGLVPGAVELVVQDKAEVELVVIRILEKEA